MYVVPEMHIYHCHVLCMCVYLVSFLTRFIALRLELTSHGLYHVGYANPPCGIYVS